MHPKLEAVMEIIMVHNRKDLALLTLNSWIYDTQPCMHAAQWAIVDAIRNYCKG